MNIGAVFWFCRVAEMDIFLTRFSALPYICSGFSVFERYEVCGYSLLHYGSRFAGIMINEACANDQYNLSMCLIDINIWLFGGFISWEKLPLFLPLVH